MYSTPLCARTQTEENCKWSKNLLRFRTCCIKKRGHSCATSQQCVQVTRLARSMLSLKGKKASELTTTDCRELIQFFFSAADRSSGTSSNMDFQTAKSGPCQQNKWTLLSQRRRRVHGQVVAKIRPVAGRPICQTPTHVCSARLTLTQSYTDLESSPLQWCRSHTGQLRWPSPLSSHRDGTSCSGHEGGVSATSCQLCHLPVGYSGYETADLHRFQ